MSVFRAIAADCRANPTLWRLVALSACAALGSALPGLFAFAHRVLA